jgi:protein TonB
MEIHQIPQADILDIIFEGRNKAYGAYDLRKTYNRRLIKALALTGSFCILLTGVYMLAGRLQKKQLYFPEVGPDVIISEAIPASKIIAPPPPVKLKAQQIATMKDAQIRIVPNDQVKPEEVPPANADVDKMKIGNANQQGEPENGSPESSPGNVTGKGIAPAPPQPDNQDIILIVEIESAYPGGLEGWRRFLLKTFHYPETAAEQGIHGTVVVQFIVDQEGNISNAEAISGPVELREEAVRTIRKSGKWTPAIQNGRKVKSYKRQPIVCALAGE